MSSNPIVVITGSSQGIGAARARLFAKNAYSICINYRSNREAANNRKQKVQARGAPYISVKADVAAGIYWLAADASSCATGTIIDLTGGR
ncbi:MAG: SDR family NAD(P)-dependent oxidoreductase [Gammaproteobacteria bacterium]|nr:SDR family NAD(P)-dependent oxidoreductase [Gammaproteobacteria bacterium]MDD9896168.1 SDR family NAD(P)-dependent oxidoreductase [Gammaproteobacteria bacterium]MDD9957495.1 SDR family NAD(P)-dependent oxidoreductase [Gammaproteobacteria bacterium]